MPEKPWCYDTLLDSVRKAWDEHDKTCASLPHLWLGRKGGVSSPGDFTSCDGCGAVFFWEGLDCVNRDDPEAEDDIWLCECCRRAPAAADGGSGTAATGTGG